MVDLSNEPIENLVEIIMGFGKYGDWIKAAELLIEKGYRFTPDELKLISSKKNHSGATYLYKLAELKYVFSPDELISLGNPADNFKMTIAHRMIGNGYDGFTVDQVIALCDPMNNNQETLSYLMAKNGHHFTFEEIIRLNNPADTYKISLAHLMAHYCEFTVGDLLLLGNPTDRDGDTVAHLMAKAGHRFSYHDLMRLGNPKNNHGDTIAHVMVQAGHKFTTKEMKNMKLPFNIEQVSMFLDIKNRTSWEDAFVLGTCGELYVNGTLCMSVAGATVRIYNPDVFSVFADHTPTILQQFDEKTLLRYKGGAFPIFVGKYDGYSSNRMDALKVYSIMSDKRPRAGSSS